ncbi:MAG: hypothetical protein CVV44_16795 [Spirochaetae bacterium HGW-Spirochaetae-1]|jgi:RNA polymerase sigma-70 factor (ECF subfamily)|nr:MAG: hypothetical protein CVV44_16795 [Spirochaetae bacterium HGW-Spirochaetae-1]
MIKEDKLIQIYSQTGRELFIYIYRFIGSRETAEDILHDCFVNLIEYSKKHELREETVRAFLYRTAHNLSINHLKRKKRIEFTAIDEINSPAIQDGVGEKIERDELKSHINAYVETLDGVTRSIFVMKKELGMSIPEIAEKTGKSERTVRRKLHTVMEGLTEYLKKGGFISFILACMAIFVYLFVQYSRGNVSI